MKNYLKDLPEKEDDNKNSIDSDKKDNENELSIDFDDFATFKYDQIDDNYFF